MSGVASRPWLCLAGKSHGKNGNRPVMPLMTRDKIGTSRDKTGTNRDKTGISRDKTGTARTKQGQ